MGRETVLCATDRPSEALRFLALAHSHSRQAYTVAQAAEVFKVSVRKLSRLSIACLSYPPGLIIDLVRIVSVANEIRATETALKDVSFRHAFPHPSAMGRLFHRFVGVSPGVYRTGARLQRLSESDQEWPKSVSES